MNVFEFIIKVHTISKPHKSSMLLLECSELVLLEHIPLVELSVRWGQIDRRRRGCCNVVVISMGGGASCSTLHLRSHLTQFLKLWEHC